MTSGTDRRLPRSRMAYVAIAITLILLCLNVFAGFGIIDVADGSAYKTGERIGNMIGAMLVGALLGGLAYVLFRNQGPRVGWTLFSLIVGFQLLAALPEFTRSAEGARQIAAAEALMKDINATAQSELDAQGYADIGVDEISGFADRLDRIAGDADTVEGKVLESTAAAMRKTMLTPRREYDVAVERLIDAGGIDPATFQSREDVDARLELAEDAAAKSAALRTAFQSYVAQFRAEMQERNVPERAIDEILAAGHRGGQIQLVNNIQDSDRRLIADMIKLLKLLRDHWGEWAYDAADHTVTFDLQAFDELYYVLLDRIDRTIVEQEALQRRLFSSGQSSGPR